MYSSLSLFLPFAIIKEDRKVVYGLLLSARSVFCGVVFIRSSATLIFEKVLVGGFTFTHFFFLKTNRVVFFSAAVALLAVESYRARSSSVIIKCDFILPFNIICCFSSSSCAYIRMDKHYVVLYRAVKLVISSN